MKHSPFQGFHPLTVEWGWGKCHNSAASVCSQGPAPSQRAAFWKHSARADRLWQVLLATAGFQLLVQGSGQQKGCMHMHTWPQLHALWIGAHIVNPTMVNWLLDRNWQGNQQPNNSRKPNSLPSPLDGGALWCHKGSQVSLRSHSEHKKRLHSPEQPQS